MHAAGIDELASRVAAASFFLTVTSSRAKGEPTDCPRYRPDSRGRTDGSRTRSRQAKRLLHERLAKYQKGLYRA